MSSVATPNPVSSNAPMRATNQFGPPTRHELGCAKGDKAAYDGEQHHPRDRDADAFQPRKRNARHQRRARIVV